MNDCRREKTLLLMSTLGMSALVFLAAPFFGMRFISPEVLFRDAGLDSTLFWDIRVPRVCAAFLAGSALALSGMTFQAMFRNPLATPFTLGTSSGASLGAALYVQLGLSVSLLGIPGITLFAFLGAVLAILLVYGLTLARRGFTTASMLLAGVAISFFFSSLILFLQYISDFTHAYRIMRWLMGGLEVLGFETVLNLLPFVIAGSAILLYLTHELNLMMTGEEMAASRGVDVKRVRTFLFFATSLMVGSVVALFGPIGFVGMMVPHICRLLIGANHCYLAPASFFFGGTFLVLCDTLARTVIAPAEIPVGVITALLGGPFFVWLLVGGTLARGGFLEK